MIEEAKRWFERLKNPTPEINAAFSAWITQSPAHVEAYLWANGFMAEAYPELVQ